jgi:putative ABC transport system ATP-binding protein
VIDLKDLSRTFYLGETPVHALAGVTETISTGDHVAIMGPSGSGKSTLLHILGCLDRPTSGEYLLDGQSVEQLSDAELTRIRRHKIGFVFQFFHLIGRLTAAENVELPMVFAGVPANERRQRVLEALRRVDLEPRMRHRPEELSGGERQRVALARAIIMRPNVILADEPTGNLDTASGNVVLDLLDDLNDAGMTIVVVTHDPRVAHRAERIVVLVDGRVSLRVPGTEISRVLALMTAEDTPEGAGPESG